jgi:hypothetical protein
MTNAKTQSKAPAKVDRDLERAKSAVESEVEAAKGKLNQAGESLRSTASDAVEKTKTVVSDQAEGGKDAVAASMHDFASAVRKASDELGSRDQSMAANLVREVASGLEDASRSLQGSSIGDLTRSVSDFARRQPSAFLIGAAVAGIALGRFVKATDERPHGVSAPTAPATPATPPANPSRVATPRATPAIGGSHRDR